MQARFIEVDITDWHKNIEIKNEGNKFFLVTGNQKLLDENKQPFISKSTKGAAGKIKQVIEVLNEGGVINLVPVEGAKSENSEYYNNCEIIAKSENEPEQDIVLSSGLAKKLYFIKCDHLSNKHQKNNGTKPISQVKITFIVNQSGFYPCPGCSSPYLLYLSSKNPGPKECVICGDLIKFEETI